MGDDLWAEVFRRLEGVALESCRAVSTTWKARAGQNEHWRRLIAARYNGLEAPGEDQHAALMRLVLTEVCPMSTRFDSGQLGYASDPPDGWTPLVPQPLWPGSVQLSAGLLAAGLRYVHVSSKDAIGTVPEHWWGWGHAEPKVSGACDLCGAPPNQTSDASFSTRLFPWRRRAESGRWALLAVALCGPCTAKTLRWHWYGSVHTPQSTLKHYVECRGWRCLDGQNEAAALDCLASGVREGGGLLEEEDGGEEDPPAPNRPDHAA